MTKNLYIIAGPSYSGKTTLANALVREGYYRAVSCTTRSSRGAQDHYNFFSREGFMHLVESDALLEWAEYSGELYGMLKSELDASDICIVEPQGVHNIVSYYDRTGERGVRVIGLTADLSTLRFRFSQDPSHGIERLQNDASRFQGMNEWCDIVIDTITPMQTLLRVLNYIEREEAAADAADDVLA